MTALLAELFRNVQQCQGQSYQTHRLYSCRYSRNTGIFGVEPVGCLTLNTVVPSFQVQIFWWNYLSCSASSECPAAFCCYCSWRCIPRGSKGHFYVLQVRALSMEVVTCPPNRWSLGGEWTQLVFCYSFKRKIERSVRQSKFYRMWSTSGSPSSCGALDAFVLLEGKYIGIQVLQFHTFPF